jgi:hypothetical protein
VICNMCGNPRESSVRCPKTGWTHAYTISPWLRRLDTQHKKPITAIKAIK